MPPFLPRIDSVRPDLAPRRPPFQRRRSRSASRKSCLRPWCSPRPIRGPIARRISVAVAALDLAALRKSEDCYVDELFGDAPLLGSPLVRALFPRAYLDVNREPYELDPEMFDAPPAAPR